MDSSKESLSVLGPTMSGSAAVMLTPGRTRNIAQDMEALRLSRQDNPYLQQVMASRESLIESRAEEYESDDTILMSQEFGSTALDFMDDDPLTLKEVHEHMIRSPPPTSCWPHDTLSYRASSVFEFDPDGLFGDAHEKEMRGELGRSPGRDSRSRPARSASPRAPEPAPAPRPLSLPGESHLRNALGKKCNTLQSERFTLLQHSRRGEDSIRLVQNCDK